MKLIEDVKSERLITLQFTESELATLYVALGEISHKEVMDSGNYYKFPILTHEDKFFDLYEHLKEVLEDKGDKK